MDAFRQHGHSALAYRRRKITLVFPREHGAWAMLLVPFVAGLAAGVNDHWTAAAATAGLLGLAGIIFLHLGRPSLIRLLKRRMANGSFGQDSLPLAAGFAALFLPGVAIILLLGLAAGYSGLFWFALGAASLAALHTSFSLRHRDRSAVAELIGVLLLTMSAPLGFYLGNGALKTESLLLWFLTWLYFGASIFVVKARLRGAASRSRLTPAKKLRLGYKIVVYLAFMAAAISTMVITDLVPAAVALAYIPALLWSLISVASIGSELRVKQEGVIQTALAIWFLVVLMAAFM